MTLDDPVIAGQTVLDSYLSAHIDGFRGLRKIDKFSGGQSNPTYRLTAESGIYVLRRKPFGTLLKSAHAVDREFRVMQALQETDVPVARVRHLCADENVLGTMFYVMDFVEGRTFWNPALPELSRSQRAATYDAMNRTLAAIHAVDIDAVGLTDFGKSGNYFARQLTRWVRQYRASETETVDAMDEVIRWLEAHPSPPDAAPALVHGDFRLDNMIFDPAGATVYAVMDWELSTLGHPLADLAYQCGVLRMPAGHEHLSGLAGLDRAALGIPQEQAYIESYCARRGLEGIDSWEFYLVFGLFRIAAIVQGVKARALQGNASGADAGAVGAMVQPLAETARQIAERGASS
ncbi:MAG: phosphotransferase family protein [Pseudomonadota bacterium]